MNSSRVEVKRMLLDKWIALVEKHGQEAGLEAEMRMKAIFASEDDRRKLESVRPVNARLMELTKRAMDDTRADEAYIDTVDSRSHSDRQALIERKVALYKEELRILVDTRDMLANLLPR